MSKPEILSQTMTQAELSLAYPPFPHQIPDRVLAEGRYEARFARTTAELEAVQRLRFEIFNIELGEGLEESYETGRDADEFDPVCHHLIVIDRTTSEIVGTYRLQTYEMAMAGCGFYSSGEFDLQGLPEAVLRQSIELGRACVAESHRNTQVLFMLFRGLALYVSFNQMRYFFGCCSLTSQDPVEARAVMAHLEEKGDVHPEYMVVPQPGLECYSQDLQPDPSFQVKIPMLFRIYLRHGALVCGPPAIDRQFKTIDYLVLFDVNMMSERQIRTFFG